ncbi:MAG TPA: 16S rRNA (adenine(1518)-N(6)/adenine(1519)-N(6))-dimethyltransferase RsmA [Pseudomonadota bacterium]|nr:16S rRNA (adenine(1518)-N(6)/adenine(1519)-N(6))-dimethyltransferase RsmA [Pseudomonadota bacterium]
MPLPISPSETPFAPLCEPPSAPLSESVEVSGPPLLHARPLLQKYRLLAKKSWGQNFLHDERSFAALVRAAAPLPTDCVVEIGAGLGTLTSRLLATGAHVTAIERERDMCEVLRRELGNQPNFTLKEENALTVDFFALAKEHGQPLVLIGNLPYQIASPLLFRFLSARACFRTIVLMLQKEMADRLLARPGTRETSALSIQVQMVCRVERVCPVGRGAFIPAPNVDSAVVRLVPLLQPLFPVSDLGVFHKLVRAAFATRRKTLRNALSAAFSDEEMAKLEHVGIDLQRRAESLLLSEFAALCQAVSQTPGDPPLP